MKSKTISFEQLASQTGKFVKLAGKQPVLVRAAGVGTLVLRRLTDDEIADELIVKSPRFRASVRKARREHAKGKSIPLAEVRRRLKA